MRTLLPCLILYLLYLIGERIALDRARRRIPHRIAVTGTRGKSSVTRLLTSILREDGCRVMAKTTGSQAVILLPEGGQIELDRSVIPSILEQKRVIKRAARLKADCIVAEVMSIRPENHFAESRQILRPDIVVITNVRRDHTEMMGETEEEIASVLSLDICPQSTVFMPEKEDRPSFRAEAAHCGASLIPVQKNASASLLETAPDLSRLEFPGDLDLVYAVASHMGIDGSKIVAGIRKAQHDIGRLNVRLYRPDGTSKPLYLINAFAGNDPESTFEALSKVTGIVPEAAGNLIGILNLRADRAQRTLQWISVLRAGASRRFKCLFVAGDHAAIVCRRVPDARVLKAGPPEEMMKKVCAKVPVPAVVFGFGNVKGAGRLLIEYWNKIGVQFGSD